MYTEENKEGVETEVSEAEHKKKDEEEEDLTQRMAEDYLGDSITVDARDSASMDVSGRKKKNNKRKFGETRGSMSSVVIEGGTESCAIREIDCTTHIESVKKLKGPVTMYDSKGKKTDRRRQIRSSKGKVATLNKVGCYHRAKVLEPSKMEVDAVIGIIHLSHVQGYHVLQRREQLSSSRVLSTFRK